MILEKNTAATLLQASGAERPTRHIVYCRSFAITAEFPDADATGIKAANDFMMANPGHGVLDIADGWVILAALDDKGIEVEPETSTV